MSRVYNFSAGPAVLPEEVLKEAADEMLDYRGTGMSVMEMSHRSKAFETIRVYNFSAGPAVLPEEVLKEAADEMLDYRGTGMSVMEMSHRSKAFETIIQEAEADLRELMNIPDNYKVLFLQGGASQQFAMIPMNLMKNQVADYIVTGQWAKKAAAEAEKYGTVHRIASSADQTFSYIPDCSDLPISSAGPAVLPEEVLKEAADEMLDYRGTGMSVMEMSHRSKAFETIIQEAEAELRELMDIPDNYKVLFLQGGASQQFAMIPMNLMKNRVADYIVTGQWAKKAADEAEKYGTVNRIASSADKTFSYIPDCSDLPVSEDADYVYICENNTIYGTKFKELPNTKGKTLVADVSSCFLSEPVDVTKYGVIYGGVQKNIGPAGVVIVIIREDLITEDVLDGTPTMLTYKTHVDADSLYNTPPAYGIYICGKVFKWLKKMGGLSAMKEKNEKKARLLYDFLDESKLFKGTVEKKDRSLMNVPFVTGDKELDAKFVKEAKEAGLENLKGHRSVGGMRASIYNAMPYEGVEALVAFMKKFEEENA